MGSKSRHVGHNHTCYLTTLWTRVLEKLAGVQLAKKYTACYGVHCKLVCT